MNGAKALFVLVGALALGAGALGQAGSPAFAQGGSTGGVIGKQDKAISGEAPAVRGGGTPAAPTRPRAAPTPAPRACPNILGVWNSWASGAFGKGDTTFSADGSAIHRSGIRGRWQCDNGRLFITWGSGKTNEYKVTGDARSNATIVNLANGRVGFSR